MKIMHIHPTYRDHAERDRRLHELGRACAERLAVLRRADKRK